MKKQIKEHALYDLNTKIVWKPNHDDGTFVDLYFILFFIACFVVFVYNKQQVLFLEHKTFKRKIKALLNYSPFWKMPKKRPIAAQFHSCLFPYYTLSVHLLTPLLRIVKLRRVFSSIFRTVIKQNIKPGWHHTCCLKYLLSSSSTRTKFKKYLTENFLFTSLIVGVGSYPAKNSLIGIDSPGKKKQFPFNSKILLNIVT